MRKAIAADKRLVSEILVSAFEPMSESSSINLVVKQDENRKERMIVLMDYMFDNALTFGEVYISDNDQACILLKFPHLEKVTCQTIGADLKLAFKCIGIENVLSVLKRQRMMSRNYPKENQIRPMIMGVKEERNGQGTAARLMFEVKNKYKDNQLPVIVDAASEDNVHMYEKFGFKIYSKEDSLGFPIYFLRLN